MATGGCYWLMLFAPRCRLQGPLDWVSAQLSKIGTHGNFDAPPFYHSYAGLKPHKYQVIPSLVYRNGCACCSFAKGQEDHAVMEQSSRWLVCVPAYPQNPEYGGHPPQQPPKNELDIPKPQRIVTRA